MKFKVVYLRLGKECYQIFDSPLACCKFIECLIFNPSLFEIVRFYSYEKAENKEIDKV